MGFLHLPTTTSNCKNTVKYETILCEIANSIYTLSTIFYSTYNISRMNENLIIRRRHTQQHMWKQSMTCGMESNQLSFLLLPLCYKLYFMYYPIYWFTWNVIPIKNFVISFLHIFLLMNLIFWIHDKYFKDSESSWVINWCHIFYFM